MARRTALLGLLGLATTATVLSACDGSGPAGSRSPEEEVLQDALALQRRHGWSVGAESTPLALSGTSETSLTPADLDGLEAALEPKKQVYKAFYGPALFRSLTAVPTLPSPTPATALREAVRPLWSPVMETAELQGRGLSTLFERAPAGRALIVDLPGPRAVSFAAGLANRFAPIFWFDGWPHPNGVVAAHHTLAAVLHHLPWFQQMAGVRAPQAPPVFVLDSNRMAVFREPGGFDNRYLAQLPSASQLRKLGVSELLYVRPRGTDREPDDLNNTFVEYRAQRLDIRVVAADAFVRSRSGEKPPVEDGEGAEHTGAAYRTNHPYDGKTDHFTYGGLASHWFFYTHYGWGRSGYLASRPTHYNQAPRYEPVPRQTGFGPGGKKPAGFGEVRVRKAGARTTLSPDQTKP